MPGNLLKSIDLPGNRNFSVVIYDLLYEQVDCIVSAASSGLSHGGGVAAVIAEAAGPALKKEGDRIVREQGRVPVGEAVVTTAGNLPFKGVVHAVGPRMGDGDEENKLVRTLQSAFLRAHERGWSSLSFPGVSSGIFCVSAPICAKAYVRAVVEFFEKYPDSSLKTIRLCLFKSPLVEEVKKRMNEIGQQVVY